MEVLFNIVPAIKQRLLDIRNRNVVLENDAENTMGRDETLE